jgi:hypothetical protein
LTAKAGEEEKRSAARRAAEARGIVGITNLL